MIAAQRKVGYRTVMDYQFPIWLGIIAGGGVCLIALALIIVIALLTMSRRRGNGK
jgi:hypothetical protein